MVYTLSVCQTFANVFKYILKIRKILKERQSPGQKGCWF